MIMSVVRFYSVETTREMVAWATGFVFFCLTVSMLKVWYWMELNKNAVTREIKRLELQLARLVDREDFHSSDEAS
jgi:hypothetical protein